MAHNDEAGGSGGKQFWELSQELEEEPHRYEDAAEAAGTVRIRLFISRSL
jgi:hypothetical protein